MQDLEFSVIFNEQQKQSGDLTADNDLFNEVVSIIAEQTIFNNNTENKN